MSKPRLGQEFLRECFWYFPDAGILCWRSRPDSHFDNVHRCNNWNARWAGKEAGQVHKVSGYRTVSVGGWTYKVHVLMWVHYFGRWPEADVDHRDLIRTNNRVLNLRDATRSENIANRRKQSNNSSGHKGVSWSGVAKKWTVQIQVRGVYRYLGLFDSLSEAAAKYELESKAAFGDFARVV